MQQQLKNNKSPCRPTNNKEKNEYKCNFTPSVLKDDGIGSRYRVIEEFYDFANDPDALHDLSEEPKYKKELDKMRKELLNWMKRTNDPALEALENRSSPEALKIFMAEQDAKSDRKKIENKKRTSQNKLLTK